MQDAFTMEEDPSPADLSPELTRHFRGLRMWISLQLLGISPFRAALDEKVLLARYFYDEIQKLGFEVGSVPELSIVIFRYVPKSGDTNVFNQDIVERIMQDGRIFLSSTTIDDVFWIRFAVLSFRTHLKQVQLAMELLKGITSKA
jgi:glutamate/tyrosine decarboxylase-like PLP-dependent enzyme